MLCPECQQQYPADVFRCPADGVLCLSSVEEALVRGRMPFVEAVQIALGVLRALESYHERGRVIGVVCPGTVFFTAEGGLVRVHLAPGAVDTVPPAYRPPEAAPRLESASDLKPTFDLYGVGVLTYHAIVGRPPLPGQPFDPSVLHELPGVPEMLSSLLGALTAASPAARPSLLVTRETFEMLERLELDTTVLDGGPMWPDVQVDAGVPARQLVLGPDPLSTAAGNAETIIRNHGALREGVGLNEPQVEAVPGDGLDEPDEARTLIASARLLEEKSEHSRDAHPPVRWWWFIAVLVAGALVGSAVVRWLSQWAA